MLGGLCIRFLLCTITKLHSQFHAFLMPVMAALNAFVSRRQQAIHAESVHKNCLNESVASVSYDLIQLETKVVHHVLTDKPTVLVGH